MRGWAGRGGQVVVARRGEDLSAAVRADEEEVTRLLLDLVEVTPPP